MLNRTLDTNCLPELALNAFMLETGLETKSCKGTPGSPTPSCLPGWEAAHGTPFKQLAELPATYVELPPDVTHFAPGSTLIGDFLELVCNVVSLLSVICSRILLTNPFKSSITTLWSDNDLQTSRAIEPRSTEASASSFEM